MVLKVKRPKIVSKKHHVALCCIFKNEAPYLVEWLIYHKTVGVDHVYMYNNYSTDNYMQILRPFIEAGFVTLIDWPYEHAQMEAYNDCITTFRDETNWLGFIDVDEFVTPNNDASIFNFLQKFDSYPAVKLYWKVFGTSGLINRKSTGLVTEDFISCWPKYDEVGKCFYNTAFSFDYNSTKNKGLHHAFWGIHLGIEIPPVNCFYKFSNHQIECAKDSVFPIQINHYFTKSFDEYVVKASKGDVYYKTNPHNLNYFYRHEMLCTDVDYHAYKYLIKLKISLSHFNKENRHAKH